MTCPAAPSRRSMKGALASLAAGAVLALAAPIAAHAQDEGAGDKAETAEMTKGEKRLAKMLEGRVAGEPVNCIRVVPNQRMVTIDKTAYVYGRGDTIYVQRTKNPDDISEGDVLVSRRFMASELCRMDVMTTADRILGFFTGAVFFEDFVPYTRVDDAADEAEDAAA
ncbi:hypothetical protein [Erythrobacter sp.]|uniref:hypothetical protein n=1 Tax=Erythrobacter sp. TaxID=1042 RepID=UPI001425C65C|nr:hypothetical protein [Erythrobacter sp.]QIQ88239.1 MAG: hypothetical protein G9473_11590 [Erythrobacter sp.]